MINRPDNIEGDLLGLTLVSALINEDMSLIQATVGALRTRGDLLGALRVVSNAFAASLQVNLGKDGALHQVEMYREAMLKEFSRDA